MKNRLLSIFCSAALVFAAIPFSTAHITANAAVFKGSGTADDPYQISSKEELKKMRDLVNSTYFSSTYGYAYKR